MKMSPCGPHAFPALSESWQIKMEMAKLFSAVALCRPLCHVLLDVSEQIAVRACAGQFEDEDVFVNLVDEKPVWRDVALSVIRPVADKRMVAVLGRKHLAVGELSTTAWSFSTGR